MIGYKKHSGGFIRGPPSGVFKIPPLNGAGYRSQGSPVEKEGPKKSEEVWSRKKFSGGTAEAATGAGVTGTGWGGRVQTQWATSGTEEVWEWPDRS
jgi:hypothetical protein